MEREQIIRMAREADIDPHDMSADFTCNLKDMERFASLVASAEREACAKVCEDNATDLSEGDWDSACNNCADHIRARGQA